MLFTRNHGFYYLTKSYTKYMTNTQVKEKGKYVKYHNINNKTKARKPYRN